MVNRLFYVLALGAAFVALNGCGGTGTVAPQIRNYLGTQAHGDVWDWTIQDGTFSATNETTGFTYSGAETDLPTGFMKLTIQNTTDPNVSAGQAAYALEMPGTALIIKPAGDDTKPPIVAGSLGTNPPGPTVSFNYVKVPSPTWAPGDESYGHVTFTVTGTTYSGTTKRFAIDGTALPDGPCLFTADNGRMTDASNPNNPPATGAMTPSGVCAIDYGPNNGGVIGVRQPASDVDLAVIGAKSYKGYLINQGKTQCVSCTPNGDGTLHGLGYSLPSGVETGTSDNGSGVTVTFLSQPNPGLVRFSIQTSGGSETLVACVAQVGGKTMLFGFGAGTGEPYNVLLVER